MRLVFPRGKTCQRKSFEREIDNKESLRNYFPATIVVSLLCTITAKNYINK